MFASVRKNRLWGENEKQGGREDAVILWNNNNVDNDNNDDNTGDNNDNNDESDDDDDNDEDNKNIKTNAEVFKIYIRFS